MFWIDLDAAGKRSHDQIVSEANVALYPYAGIQHPPGDLDG